MHFGNFYADLLSKIQCKVHFKHTNVMDYPLLYNLKTFNGKCDKMTALFLVPRKN